MIGLNSEAENAAMRRTRAAEIRSLTDQIWAINVNVGWEIFGLQSGSGSREKAEKIASEMSPLLEQLRKKGNLTNDSKHIQEFETSVRELLRREMVLANTVDADGLEIPFYSLGVMRGELKQNLNQLARIKKLVEEEAAKETVEQTKNGSVLRSQTQNAWLSFVVISILVGLIYAHYFYRNIASRFAIILENSRRFGKRAPLVQEIGGSDEIAYLDRTFHEMWNAVEAASKRERAMIDNAVDVICSLNEFGAFSAVSPATQRMWGYQQDELLGKNLAEIIVSSDQTSALDALTDSRHAESASFESRVSTKDGGIRDMQWSVQWSRENQTFFCVVHDISERKAIERLKQDFVNMISHDLKTPLTSVRLTLELVLQGVYGELDNKGKNRIAVAQDSTDRLLELINQLLQLEKLEAGKMEIDKAPYAVQPLLVSACDSLQSFAEQHDVQTRISCPDNLVAELDADRIIQVVINLVSNSIKFSPAKSTVLVSAERDGEQLIVSVKDEGRGVPEHLQESIFNRFEQVERDDSEQRGGTGLGLAICKAIVQAHDGQIGVESSLGAGSRFWFKIPQPETSAKERIHATH
jgi:PAS domain S-box-containing protein